MRTVIVLAALLATSTARAEDVFIDLGRDVPAQAALQCLVARVLPLVATIHTIPGGITLQDQVTTANAHAEFDRCFAQYSEFEMSQNGRSKEDARRDFDRLWQEEYTKFIRQSHGLQP